MITMKDQKENKVFTLKVLYKFFDNEEGRERKKDEIFECSEQRAKQILSFDKYQLVEILSIIKK